ncbi:MAG: mechanosensitive ion channel family protein [Bacteroidota bacterium]
MEDSSDIEVSEEIQEATQLNQGFRLGLTTPRQAVMTHLYYLQQENYAPEKAAEALVSIGNDPKAMERMALRLKQIYDGEGYEIVAEDISDNKNWKDTAGIYEGKARFVVFDKYPEIYVEKTEKGWQYSRRSLKAADRIHDKLFPIGSEVFMNLLPGYGQKQFLGLFLWQYLGMLILLVGAFILNKLVDIVFSQVIRSIIPRIFARNAVLESKEVLRVASPLSMVVVTLVLLLFIPTLQLPIGLGKYVVTGVRILGYIFGVLFAYRLVGLVAAVAAQFATKTETAMDDQLIPLISKIARGTVVIFGIIFILQNLDVNVTALLAGVSIGGLALAFAAQDTVKNFLGSISIFVDRPFQIGDFIVTDQLTGVVTEVGVRSTRVRELGGAQVTIPNGVLANLTITNHGVRNYRRFATSLTVNYGTSPDQMTQFVDGVREIASNHPSVDADSVTVHFHEMGSSSLDIFFAMIIQVTDYGHHLKVRQEVLLEVIKLAEKLGVEFAFPSTSLYVESLPDNSSSAQQP